jgi:hypothetical protein
MPFYNEGVMGSDIQIVANIIFNDDCLRYLCMRGMGVNMPKARASPSLRAEALRRESVREGRGDLSCMRYGFIAIG